MQNVTLNKKHFVSFHMELAESSIYINLDLTNNALVD